MPVEFRRGERARERLSQGFYRSRIDRERYYSLFAVTAVKIVLLVFLLAFCGLMIKLLKTSFVTVGTAYRVFLPMMIAVIVLLLASDIRKRVKELKAMRRERRQRDP